MGSKASILGSLNKTYGENAVQKIGHMGKVAIPRDSTGSLEVDYITGGGFPQGKIIEIYGPESSGKTTLTLHGIAEKQKQQALLDKPREIAFIDMEHALDPYWAETIGVDIDNIVLSQPNCGEDALEIAHQLITSGEYCMIVIDSVAALRPRKEIQGEMGDAIVGLQAKLMAQACPKIAIAANQNKCTVIFINQLREKIGITFGSPETTPGGKSLKFYAGMRLDIRNIGQILDSSGERIGNKTKIKCVKNKASKPFGVCETRLSYGVGIDRVWEILRAAINFEIVTKKGSHHYLGEIKLGNGENNVLEFLRQDPDTLEGIEHLITKQLQPNV